MMGGSRSLRLYRYHCRSRERLEGGAVGGSCCEDGVQLDTSREMCSLAKSDPNIKSTEPGGDAESDVL